MKSLKELHEQRIRIANKYNNKIYSEFWSLKYWRLYMQRMKNIVDTINSTNYPYKPKKYRLWGTGDFAPDYAMILCKMNYGNDIIYKPNYKKLFEQEYNRKQF